jgi:hypothetical protein
MQGGHKEEAALNHGASKSEVSKRSSYRYSRYRIPVYTCTVAWHARSRAPSPLAILAANHDTVDTVLRLARPPSSRSLEQRKCSVYDSLEEEKSVKRSQEDSKQTNRWTGRVSLQMDL